MTEIVTFVDEGLGHSSYLVDLGDGRALVVDPPRIPDQHIAAARLSANRCSKNSAIPCR